ncbi:MAG TPA: transcription-repair coupling factor [Candidatus Nanopelagicales bacterium]|nr:transcription-repair coupling factor [Candidatus Nanopelagicales bacterium]
MSPTLTGLLDAVLPDPAVGAAVRRARLTGTAQATESLDVTAPAAYYPLLIGALAGADGADRPVLAVTATAREAEDLEAALASLLPEESVASFPGWETLPHERLSPSSDTVGRRLGVLRRLAHPDPSDPATGPVRVVVAPVRAVLQPVVKGLGDLEPVSVQQGDEVAMDDLVRRLSAAAYTRTDLVDKRGQFAVRGGILDVFPPTEEHPVRLEFWGDTVEEIRWFKVADQRSLEVAPHGLWAPPCRELLLTDEVRARARALAPQHPELLDLLDKLADGIGVEGMEALAPVLADGMELLVDLLPEGSLVVVCDPERVRTRAHDLVATSDEFLAASWHNAAAGNVTPIDLRDASYRSVADVRAAALDRGIPWWGLSPFGGDMADDDGDLGTLDPDLVDRLTVDVRAADSYRGETSKAMAQVGEWLSSSWAVVLVTAGHGTAERVAESVRGEGLAVRLVPELAAVPEAGTTTIVTGGLEHGFVSAELRLAVLTETDLVGQRSTTRDVRRMPTKRRASIDPLQLKPGDYVVHEQHGVGRYVEMVQRTVAGATREYLVIEYAPAKRGQPGDRLYVPTDQLDQVTRYVGGEAPSLHRLGGADWTKTKARARKAVRQIAGELIRLYAARMASRGYAFGADTVWQRELEDAFPYNETPDQLSCIDEVKQDMENVIPMDRLICGDVGYGKTEIAVRAAFKAVQDGKQVAVLVPTTLLVQQHLSTFTERYAPFPVKVAALSRFQTDKEAKEVVTGLAEGAIDVVIGTHRLFSTEVRFKDLGLVIVDEEQRFGVEHKEHLKAMRMDVDFLTMSATPIPRTLEMAVTGIREMSTIQTPPEERHPVLTYVGPYDDKQVAAAIRRELLRDGQVFFVHNRVESIDRVASKLRELVPEARIRTAHGQMNEHALEQVIVDFWEKEFDVLVSTTIVESGLDIPNANTLILDRADMFGLSQLHQLRGRVGRSRERGYAYFLYPPEKPLTETAHDRLQTIAANTDLGSGMAVAMKDLEIRGAGNLLGGEQSGHIADVGFDLYVRLVGEAVAEYRQGGAVEEVADVKIEVPIDAHVPHDYVAEERLRLEAYKRLAAASTDEEVDAVSEELVDRYGQLPEPVSNLLAVARLRIHARRAGVTEVVVQGNYLRFSPVELPDSRAMRLSRLYPGSLVKPATRTILVPRPMTARVGGQPVRDTALLDWLRELLDAVLLEPVTAT